MSINHYSMDLPEATIWWNQNQNQNQTQTPPFPNYPSPTQALANNQNDTLPDQNDNDDEDQENDSATPRTQSEDEKEAMFEKPLTPSDVGKLNRLVIPKQHAEKYFPLADSPECKGLLLSFEDESGKCWRFRYSYWNSSQSYVLTKGWSRYVKDKRLHAGDVVLFHRHRLHAHRLFIHWRRRRPHADTPAHVSSAPKSAPASAATAAAVVVDEPWTTPFYSAHPYPAHHHALPYQHDSLHAGRGSQSQIGEEQRTRGVRNNSSSSSCSSSSRVLRLFGVNMECQPEHDSGPSTPQSLYNNNYNMPSTLDHSHHFYHHHHHQPSNSHPHMLRHQPYYY